MKPATPPARSPKILTGARRLRHIMAVTADALLAL